eukprot:TRINITY_DN56284_c0_g1_i1.p1 TRINITY_DN56284_c0_g1~~TRINITY_DN56284_c0_g1_i1.p1  ORF type:complete len:729 (-),score=87.16 TRINITY_DN56284_c0_g1_i1:84-2270(-)
MVTSVPSVVRCVAGMPTTGWRALAFVASPRGNGSTKASTHGGEDEITSCCQSEEALSQFATPRSTSIDEENDVHMPYVESMSCAETDATDSDSSKIACSDGYFDGYVSSDDAGTDNFAPINRTDRKYTVQFLLKFRAVEYTSTTNAFHDLNHFGRSIFSAHGPVNATCSVLDASLTLRTVNQRKRQSQGEDQLHVSRSLRSILNKLTIERFDLLYTQIIGIILNSSESVAILLGEIIDRAETQHNYISMYTELCARLNSDSRLKAVTKGSDDFVRLVLLQQCQSSFENHILEKSTSVEVISSDRHNTEEARTKRKVRALGCVKLIGALVVSKILSTSILVRCCEECLAVRTHCSYALDCLVALLTVGGSAADIMCSRETLQRLSTIFEYIDEIISGNDASSRERFLLRDLVELRKRCWSDLKRNTAEMRPMRLHEVRQMVSPSFQLPRLDFKPLLTKCSERGSGIGAKFVFPAGSSCEIITPHSQQHSNKLVSDAVTPRHDSHAHVAPARAAIGSVGASSAHATSLLADAGEAPLAVSPNESKRCQKLSDERGTQPRSLAIGSVEAVTSNDAAAASASVPRLRSVCSSEKEYDPVLFQKEIVAIFRELTLRHDVAAAVRRVRSRRVPGNFQAKEIANMLARAAEESRGPARRIAFAFTAALAKGNQSAFDRSQCLSGVRSFFEEDYRDLCEEISRLPVIASMELVPTLSSVFTEAELAEAIPVLTDAP